MRRKLKVIGGLGDHDMAMLLGLRLWRGHGFEPKLVPFQWQKPEGDFDSRFKSPVGCTRVSAQLVPGAVALGTKLCYC